MKYVSFTILALFHVVVFKFFWKFCTNPDFRLGFLIGLLSFFMLLVDLAVLIIIFFKADIEVK